MFGYPTDLSNDPKLVAEHTALLEARTARRAFLASIPCGEARHLVKRGLRARCR